MIATKREIMLNLPTQHKLGILQRLMVQRPVQLCPLCRGVAVFVLHGDFNLALHWKECYTRQAETNCDVFDRIQEIAKEDGTQTARVFYHCM